ncbi:uncharacterized protein BP5553_07493 [Venustampulla echinocandica]|uniref:Zn(2)-C6 fungal-type domain-containing protein n=1 Tax=Venustampulla echinocandica TaxID=2656787 RepID=A0A370TGP8_9HELO|nr:uncharacterized protein BP5553_07493 [Venustampulla echinocandica]RDL34365.1 hypothetical protein BP5553_07493 [Venustampulla echinocandica]
MSEPAPQDGLTSSYELVDGADEEGQPVPRANQACNECKRRKGKCDRVAPECSPCRRFRRHCLYEQHSKTPLTRKHLTFVEHRLAGANAEIRSLRRALNELRQQNGEVSLGTREESGEVPAEVAPETSGTSAVFTSDSRCPTITNLYHMDASQMNISDSPPLSTRLTDGGFNENCDIEEAFEQTERSSIPLEGPPTTGEEFDWDEQSMSMASELDPQSSGEEEPEFVDGMASLSVNEKDVGYLGVASGAALLRMLRPENSSRGSFLERTGRRPRTSSTLLVPQPNPHVHIVDAMIDGYFRSYHLSYPIVHEPRFRAQYSGVIQCPKDNGWQALIYVIAALGAFSTAEDASDADIGLFHAARSHLSIDDLQSGNISLVQSLTLMSNYLQKRNKPNSGYNYLGLALRMAMGLGLYKEFPGWDIKPLQMEIRRRVWWTLFVFDIGATITFSRPLGWPSEGIDVRLPLNINDRELTAVTNSYPTESANPTTYTAVRTQVAFHLATNAIYKRVISLPFPSPRECLALDEEKIVPWFQSLPPWYSESATVPQQFALSHSIMMWRYRNLRLIMYRPFVLRRSLKNRVNSAPLTVRKDEQEACNRCLHEASMSITLIGNFWSTHQHTKLAAWYALYFLFQASLLPIFCLRNDPLSPSANDWRQDIRVALSVIESMAIINPSSVKCLHTINTLCEQFMVDTSTAADMLLDPTGESPQTQINNVLSMMWPNLPELDVVMQDDNWTRFYDTSVLDGRFDNTFDTGEDQWPI